MADGEWSLSEAQREATVSRVRGSISGLAFFRGAKLPDEEVAAVAEAIEKKAYTVARVEARTTTGARPHHESLKAYLRKLSALLLEAVEGGAAGAAGRAAKDGGSESLDLTGSREFLTAESAEEELAAMLAPGAAITKIRFSTKSFGAEAAEVAARAIANVSATLVHADLSDVIAGRPEGEALAALRTLGAALGACALRTLDLSDNALGEKGIRAAAAAFTAQAGLESIAFQNVGASVHGCAALSELLVHTASLRRLHLYNNMSGDEGAASVAAVLTRCPALEDFRMVSSRVGGPGGAALGAALAAGGAGPRALLRLDLHDNPLSEEAAGALAAALGAAPALRYLNLNDTGLGDGGVATVMAALARSAPDLEELELSLNEITPAGAAAVAACVAAKPRLRRLVLRENELEDDGVAALAPALATLRCLEEVDLSGNQLRRRGAVAAARAAAASPALRLLGLDENEISGPGVEAVQAVLAAAGKGDALGPMDENMEEEDEEEEVDELAGAMASARI